MRVKVTLKERTFVLTLNTSENEDESVALFRAFGSFGENDPYLKQKSLTHYAVFEYLDPEFNSMVELSGCPKLPTKEFLVRMVPLESPLKSSTMETNHDRNGTQTVDVRDLEEAVVVELQVEVPDIVVLQNHEAIAVSVPSRGRPTQDKYTEHQYNIDTMPKPKFSKRVQQILENGQILHQTSYLIREAADHLLDLVPHPSPATKRMYIASLMIHYPELDPVTDPAVKKAFDVAEMLKKALFTHIKNRKQGRVVNDEARQRGGLIKSLEPQAAKRRLELSDGDLDNSKVHGTFDDHSNWLSQSKRQKLDNMKMHLQSFSSERREKVKECETMSTLVKMWPMYARPELIREEFNQIVGLNDIDVSQKYEVMVETLGLMLDLPIESEFDKLQCLVGAEDYLSVNIGKGYPKAFTVIQLATPKSKPKLPSSIMANAPIAAIYVAPDNRITKCFIMVEASRLCTLENPTTLQIFHTLFGTYYAYDRCYPAISRNLFDFFDFCVFTKNSANPSLKLVAFKKDYVKNLSLPL